MVNLAFADLNLGLVVVPLSAIYHVSEGLKSPLHKKIGNYLYFPYFTACTASFLRLIILTTDRFVAVTYLIGFCDLAGWDEISCDISCSVDCFSCNVAYLLYCWPEHLSRVRK